MKYLLLLFSVLCFFTSNALGQTFLCDRISLDASGFTSRSSAESWFRKKVKIVADLNKKTAIAYGQTTDLYIREDNKRLKATFFIKTRSGRRIPLSFVFLANGEVHSSISQQAGYKTTGGGIYKCSGWTGSL